MSRKSIVYTHSDDLVYEYTTFDEIYKMFLNSISSDYRIKNLFQKDEALATDMLETWLQKAVVYFTDCLQNLEDTMDDESKDFGVVLTLQEKVILSNYMLLVWMEWNINNITQMNLSLQDSDFNRHAEAQNLKGKLEYANNLREQIFHLTSEYTNKNISINRWATGDI